MDFTNTPLREEIRIVSQIKIQSKCGVHRSSIPQKGLRHCEISDTQKYAYETAVELSLNASRNERVKLEFVFFPSIYLWLHNLLVNPVSCKFEE